MMALESATSLAAAIGETHVTRTAAQCRTRDPGPRLRGNGGVRARHRAIVRPEGNAAAPDAGLDLGRVDGGDRGQLVLDPRVADHRSVQPDPRPRDLHL